MTNGRDIAIALSAVHPSFHQWSDVRFAPHGVTTDPFVLPATDQRTEFLFASKG